MDVLNSFSNSIFYPAGGTDLQVLLRLSDVSDTVISPTLSDYLSPEVYAEVFSRKCQHINNFYGREVLRYLDYEVLDSDFIERNRFIGAPAGLFQQREMAHYNEAFSRHFQNEVVVLRFNFMRVIGELERPVSWIAMNTEGLATLCSLVKMTNEHPKIVCTIQSGVLEYPDSLFVRLLERLGLRTKIWLRGYWNNGVRHTTLPAALMLPTASFPPYDKGIQDYGYWYSPMGEVSYPNEENDSDVRISKVRAFSNDDSFQPPLRHEMGEGNKKVYLLREDINGIDPEVFDLIITSKRIFTQPRVDKIKFWRDFPGWRRSGDYQGLLFIESLDIIREIVEGKKAKKIAMSTVGYEDEALALNRFIHSIDMEFELHIYFLRPLDFIKLTAPDLV